MDTQDGAGSLTPSERLGPGEVHAWLADPTAADDPAVASACERVLSDEERARLAAFRVDGARQQFLVGHALVRTALARYRPTPAGGWRFAAGPHGRPEPAP